MSAGAEAVAPLLAEWGWVPSAVLGLCWGHWDVSPSDTGGDCECFTRVHMVECADDWTGEATVYCDQCGQDCKWLLITYLLMV